MNFKPNKHFIRARTTALVLLFFLGLSALPAAVAMIADPSGSTMGLPPGMLDQTPFSNFLLPAILLGLFNGILSLLFAFLVIKKHPFQAWMVMFQGGVLLVWITTEVIMNLYYPLLTLPYYLIAILLVACGLIMRLSKSGLS
jgi:hypothetical protein